MTTDRGTGGLQASPDSSWDVRDQVAVIGRSWGLAAFLGVVSIVIGVIALVWPHATLAVLAFLFGLQLIILGLFRLVSAIGFAEGSGAARALSAILGMLALLIGLYALRHIEITVIALGLVLGIYWIIDGVLDLFAAAEHRHMPGRNWTLAAGILGIVAGIILLVWPDISLVVLAVVAGIWLIVFGIAELVAAWAIHRMVR
jgi:uncharacterized membrane protein HdeD (DUF308 family)